jgi:hypothetical protein
VADNGVAATGVCTSSGRLFHRLNLITVPTSTTATPSATPQTAQFVIELCEEDSRADRRKLWPPGTTDMPNKLSAAAHSEASASRPNPSTCVPSQHLVLVLLALHLLGGTHSPVDKTAHPETRQLLQSPSCWPVVQATKASWKVAAPTCFNNNATTHRPLMMRGKSGRSHSQSRSALAGRVYFPFAMRQHWGGGGGGKRKQRVSVMHVNFKTKRP